MSLNKSIMITGSRDVDRDTARALFEQHLSQFISQGRTWLVSTARGVDQWAMEWSTSLRAGGSVKPGVKRSEPQE